jgi:hypothetical protein
MIAAPHSDMSPRPQNTPASSTVIQATVRVREFSHPTARSLAETRQDGWGTTLPV